MPPLQDILNAIFAWTGVVAAAIAAIVVILDALAERSLPAFGYGTRKRRIEAEKFAGYLAAVHQADEQKYSKFIENVRDVDSRRIQRYLDAFYDAENAYIRKNKDLTASIILEQLGLRADRFPEIRREIVRRAQVPLTSAQERRDRISALCRKREILIDTASLRNPQYTEVRYFINFADAMFDESVGRHLANILADLVREKVCPDDMCDLTVAIPSNGNFLLGCFVAQRLGAGLVSIQPKPRLEQNQYWDGRLEAGANVVILHDVAVTGARLVDAARKLRNSGANVLGIFALVQRSDMLDYAQLTSEGLVVHAVLAVSEDELAKAMSE